MTFGDKLCPTFGFIIGTAMKNKSITLIILMLTFLSIFSVNVHFISKMDTKLDQVHFFNAGIDHEMSSREEKQPSSDQSSDTLSHPLSGRFSWVSDEFIVVLLKPFKI